MVLLVLGSMKRVCFLGNEVYDYMILFAINISKKHPVSRIYIAHDIAPLNHSDKRNVNKQNSFLFNMFYCENKCAMIDELRSVYK